MGHKTHPIGFRVGVIKGWQSRWFGRDAADYAAQVQEDLLIRKAVTGQYVDAGISRVEIERSAQDLTVNVHTARPGHRYRPGRSAGRRAAEGHREGGWGQARAVERDGDTSA